MTRMAGNLSVFPGEIKSGFVMVKRGSVPVRNGVATGTTSGNSSDIKLFAVRVFVTTFTTLLHR